MLSINFKEESKLHRANCLPISVWIAKEFSQDDGLYIKNKLENWSFYQLYEKLGMSELEFLEFLEKSLKAKKDSHIYKKIIEKLMLIAPNDFGCEPELYATDVYYRVWFLLRDSFHETMNKALSETNRHGLMYFMWDSLVDNITPACCAELKDKVFPIDDRFLVIADNHWSKVTGGCRCGLSVLNERQLAKRLSRTR